MFDKVDIDEYVSKGVINNNEGIVLDYYYVLHMTVSEIVKGLGITKQRVSQIKRGAVNKIFNYKRKMIRENKGDL